LEKIYYSDGMQYYDNQNRFTKFIDSIQRINPKTVSTRLKEMEKNGLIQIKIYHERATRIEYFLTEKDKALKSVLDQMAAFFHSILC
jgi:DNA-binding HxlR family transcriptional regulator